MNKLLKPKVSFSEELLRITDSASLNQLRQSRPRTRGIYTTKSHSCDSLANGSGGRTSSTSRDLKYDDVWCPPVPKPITVRTYFPEDFSTLQLNDDSMMGNNGTIITPNGFISLYLHDRIRVDISIDQAVRIINLKSQIFLALDSTGSSSALIHPNGRILQYGSKVEILANNGPGNNKYAKMWHKGVSFTSDQCALVYLVDSAGTRTTTDTFADLSGDITLDVFYNRPVDAENTNDEDDNCLTPPQLINEAINIIQHTTYWLSDDHTENWIINNIRISQTSDGLIRIGLNHNKFLLRTSPTNGSASITTPYIHCTGSMGKTRHLFVRRGERRMHYDGTTFIVRNAGHSAGFDKTHQLKVY